MTSTDFNLAAIASAKNTDDLFAIYDAWLAGNPDIDELEPQTSFELANELSKMEQTDAVKTHRNWLAAWERRYKELNR